MKIEIWSDFVCPFCYIGKRNLEEALKKFNEKDSFEIEFKSYQLDPNTPPYTGQDFYESMGEKFGGKEQAKQMMTGITDQAKSVGLDFRFDTMKPTNTFDAHRLTKLAKKHAKDAEITEKLLFANFTESKDVGNIDTLAEIAENVGLNKEEALTILQDKDAFAREVHADIEEAKKLGVTGVPYFVFNRKYATSGAQPVDVFIQTIEKALEEEQSIPTFKDLSKNDTNSTCDDDGCSI